MTRPVTSKNSDTEDTEDTEEDDTKIKSFDTKDTKDTKEYIKKQKNSRHPYLVTNLNTWAFLPKALPIP